MGVAPTPRATADSTAQEGAERDRSPQDWSAGHSPVGGTGVSGRAACGWAGGAWEDCPWEVPHRGRRWQSASVCWEGALGWGPGEAGGSCPTKPPVQPRRPKPGDHTPPSKTCWETPALQQAGPLLSRDTGPLEQPAFNTYSTTETADGSKRKSSVFFHWLDSTGPW